MALLFIELCMVKSYLKTAWRNLIRGKSFSIINISGLAVGMAGAILIFLWLQNEVSFDKFHANKNNLYQIYGLGSNVDGLSVAIDETSQPLGPFLKQNYPEVQAAARVSDVNSFLLTANNKSFTNIRGDFADPSFFQMFSFPLVEGNKDEQLKSVYSIAITKKLANKLFGNEDAIGKTIRIDSADNFIVTGILNDLPSNTRFDFEYLISWDYLRKIGWNNDSWVSNNTPTYVLLRPNTNANSFTEKIRNISRINAGRNDICTHFLFPLSQWHLYADFENGKPAGGRIVTVRVFGIIAIFILLIACINFMNLSTARSDTRAKEVGIRKVAGSGKGLLIGQFMTEAFMTSFIAGLFALVIVQLILPTFNTLINVQLSIPYYSISFWLSAFTFTILTSLMAGSYPAFYLSSFKPISIFRKEFKKPQGIVSPRKILVVFQFIFAIILIISTIVVRNQIQYAQDREKGYSNNNLLQINFVGDINKNYALIKQDLISSGIASSVTKTMTDIVQGGYHSWGLRWPKEIPKDTSTTITIYSTDADLVKTMGLHLVEGRDIDVNKFPTDSFSVVLNETAAKIMGFTNPIGEIITNPFDKIDWHVVGVVKDYIQGSPYSRIPPTVIYGPGAWFNMMYIKFNPSNSTADNLAKAEMVFKKYNPAYPFDYAFVDEQFAMKFENEQRIKTMAGLFASLAIIISCLGLFGLSAYVTQSRVKEIGVRKVLGASVLSIAKLLSFDFIKLVVISIFIASPIAWYSMNKWLENYTYRINIRWNIFLLAGILAILIALITVSYQSIKSAIANPVKGLRTE
jgi:putative ABC transport system permease protein